MGWGKINQLDKLDIGNAAILLEFVENFDVDTVALHLRSFATTSTCQHIMLPFF